MGPGGGSDPRAAYVPQMRDYGVPGESGASERLLCCNFGRMTKWVRRGFGTGEISTSYAHFLWILVEYDKRGTDPLGSTIESRFVRQYVNSTYCYWLS